MVTLELEQNGIYVCELSSYVCEPKYITACFHVHVPQDLLSGYSELLLLKNDCYKEIKMGSPKQTKASYREPIVLDLSTVPWSADGVNLQYIRIIFSAICMSLTDYVTTSERSVLDMSRMILVVYVLNTKIIGFVKCHRN